MRASDGRTFKYDKLTVFFKHTDYYGNLHPYYYCEWTSYVREEFFVRKCEMFREILNMSIKMITSKIEIKIERAARFGDVVEARLYAARVRKSSMDLVVEYVNKKTEEKLAMTRHSLVFLGADDGFVSIPSELRRVALRYQHSME